MLKLVSMTGRSTKRSQYSSYPGTWLPTISIPKAKYVWGDQYPKKVHSLIPSKVDRLAHVWQDIYHYKVTRSRLKSNEGKLPQVQINKDIATFVWEEDSPSTLLIVYYAGHGTPGLVPGHLELSGSV